MQRAGVENILGLCLEGGTLHLNPCIPKTWPGFTMTVRFRSAQYEIVVDNSDHFGRGLAAATVGGAAVAEESLSLKLLDDGATHHVLVLLGLKPDPLVDGGDDVPVRGEMRE